MKYSQLQHSRFQSSAKIQVATGAREGIQPMSSPFLRTSYLREGVCQSHPLPCESGAEPLLICGCTYDAPCPGLS
jgi:hypothetical protein